MYFEFHKLVDLNLPRVIFKADLLWSESNPEFDRHDITEIMLKVALSTINLPIAILNN